MLVGLGASATLPSVITGYLGNPWGSSGWIESSLAQGQKAGRWPDIALELDGAGAAAGLKLNGLGGDRAPSARPAPLDAQGAPSTGLLSLAY